MFKIFRKNPDESLSLPEEKSVNPPEVNTQVITGQTSADNPGPSLKSENTEETDLLSHFTGWIDDHIEDRATKEASLEAMASVIGSLSAYDREDALPEAFFDLIVKGANYARDVKNAEMEGEIRGRNAKIVEQTQYELIGDGVPHPGIGGNLYNVPVPSIFQLARGASTF